VIGLEPVFAEATLDRPRFVEGSISMPKEFDFALLRENELRGDEERWRIGNGVRHRFRPPGWNLVRND
jgi:hypothetical protein